MYTITRIEIKKYKEPLVCSECKIYNVGKSKVILNFENEVDITYNYELTLYNKDEIGIYSCLLGTLGELAHRLEKFEITEDCEVIIK